MKESCTVCNRPKQLEELDIQENEYWRIGLHMNQVYLGRCVVVLKRHVEDYFDTTEAEKIEFAKIGKNLRDALRSSFAPGIINYSSLGNELPHVHWHFVPRYKKRVLFEGKTFEDKNWGRNYAPYDRDFLVQKDILFKIRDKLKEKL